MIDAAVVDRLTPEHCEAVEVGDVVEVGSLIRVSPEPLVLEVVGARRDDRVLVFDVRYYGAVVTTIRVDYSGDRLVLL